MKRSSMVMALRAGTPALPGARVQHKRAAQHVGSRRQVCASREHMA